VQVGATACPLDVSSNSRDVSIVEIVVEMGVDSGNVVCVERRVWMSGSCYLWWRVTLLCVGRLVYAVSFSARWGASFFCEVLCSLSSLLVCTCFIISRVTSFHWLHFIDCMYRRLCARVVLLFSRQSRAFVGTLNGKRFVVQNTVGLTQFDKSCKWICGNLLQILSEFLMQKY